MTIFNAESPLASFSFPRTGKRGVPQQFPRRLYEMLETETKLAEKEQADGTPPSNRVIMWSDSGKAFRIFDIAEFAATVLPKYFRTKKFSSFQRNLNLYGFAKVRRGPETDMYAHPSFLRHDPEGLLNLRKVTSASRRPSGNKPKAQTLTVSPINNLAPIGSIAPLLTLPMRAISPTSPTARVSTIPNLVPASPPLMATQVIHQAPLQAQQQQRDQVKRQRAESSTEPDRGRLDLLAFALEQEAFAA
eukprot:CAMPEP_0168747782 /NCGR_PEP_ID=MMETSP0724-20121128/15835_1 /TAXON_ID=265536 /ORGANISM="Amphiprora sp., Strain CCMP467" /LENGTH=246 /DNA_ID=CAMNT_0008795585 /DNA_START=45 /DNA_END=785 /DNA_ORIENTATION=+